MHALWLQHKKPNANKVEGVDKNFSPNNSLSAFFLEVKKSWLRKILCKDFGIITIQKFSRPNERWEIQEDNSKNYTHSHAKKCQPGKSSSTMLCRISKCTEICKLSYLWFPDMPLSLWESKYWEKIHWTAFIYQFISNALFAFCFAFWLSFVYTYRLMRSSNTRCFLFHNSNPVHDFHGRWELDCHHRNKNNLWDSVDMKNPF